MEALGRRARLGYLESECESEPPYLPTMLTSTLNAYGSPGKYSMLQVTIKRIYSSYARSHTRICLRANLYGITHSVNCHIYINSLQNLEA